MTNEKRTTITMEDLMNSVGLEYLNGLLDLIEVSCKLINKMQSDMDYYSWELRRPYKDKIERCRKIQSELLSQLGTEFLLCDLDIEVRKYINERLDKMAC